MAKLVLASAVISIPLVRIYDLLGINEGVSRIARPGIFVASWTVVTAGMGMSGFTSKVRSLRRRNTDALSALVKRVGSR